MIGIFTKINRLHLKMETKGKKQNRIQMPLPCPALMRTICRDWTPWKRGYSLTFCLIRPRVPWLGLFIRCLSAVRGVVVQAFCYYLRNVNVRLALHLHWRYQGKQRSGSGTHLEICWCLEGHIISFFAAKNRLGGEGGEGNYLFLPA